MAGGNGEGSYEHLKDEVSKYHLLSTDVLVTMLRDTGWTPPASHAGTGLSRNDVIRLLEEHEAAAKAKAAAAVQAVKAAGG